MNRVASAAALGLALGCGPGLASQEEDFWDQPDLQDRTAAVSDGELRFLPAQDAAGTHVHSNRIRIAESSLKDGWVLLEQCHRDLDAVPAAQIVFPAQRIRDLQVLSVDRIGKAWVEGHSVQLQDVAPGARLCLRAETLALHEIGDGHYRLRNGPYMRRFLDGYYPMRLSLEIRYPAERLQLRAHAPESQRGFELREAFGHISIEAAFEGKLVTCLDFCSRDASCDRAPAPRACTQD